jgi:bla regulator protein blaR1
MTTEFIVNHVWQSSCFVLLAAVLALVLRKNSPKVRYWVWLSASLKFLVPLALLVNLGSAIPWPARRAVSVAAPAFPNTLVQIAEPFSPASYSTGPAQAPTHWAPVAIGIIWALGFVGITLVRCRSWLGIRAALRASTRVDLPIPVPAFITPGAEEPGVVGFLRPVLVLPAGMLEHLSSRQLEAVLTHELCHVRRRDNLFAAVHMVAEAIFWFHPLVWWIGSRMVEERELACDEEVLRMGCEPTDYVKGILKVCQFYRESPLPCVSGVTGADVKKRLRAILTGSIARELTAGKKLALAAIGLAALVGPIIIGVLNAPQVHAQSQPPARPAFDVVSIKPSRSGNSGAVAIGAQSTAGTVTLTGIKPRDVIARAYSLKPYQIVGPSWLDEEYYDIVAKSVQPVPDSEQRLMLQSMLASRFGLTAHIETRELPCYELVVRKDGLKIHPAAADDKGPRYFPNAGPTAIRGKALSMARLADLLTSKTDRPVLDRTGVSGIFDIDLKWTADSDTEPGPSLFAAVEEQLGLKLQASKSPIEALVIDHIDRPSRN